MAYQRDILDELADANRAPRYPEVEVELGMVVEDRASGYCGDIVRWTSEAVTLRDRHQHQRHFGWKDGGFRLDGRPVTLRRPAARRDDAVATRRLTASGSVAGPSASARVAAASRIWVEGRHDAELLELVWGDDLRDAAIVVEPMHGIDGLRRGGRRRSLPPLADVSASSSTTWCRGRRSSASPPPSPGPTCW